MSEPSQHAGELGAETRFGPYVLGSVIEYGRIGDRFEAQDAQGTAVTILRIGAGMDVDIALERFESIRAVAALLAFLLASIWRERREATRESRRVAQMQEFLEGLLESTETPDGVEQVTMAFLGRGRDELTEAFAGDPEGESVLRESVGVSFRQAGQLERSERELRRSLELVRELHGDESLRATDVRRELALTLESLGNCEAVLELLEVELAQPDKASAQSLEILIRILLRMGDVERGEWLLRERTALCLDQLGPSCEETVRAIGDLASFLTKDRRWDEAEPLLRATYEGWQELRGDEALETQQAALALGQTLVAKGKGDAAQPLLLRVLERRETAADDQIDSKTDNFDVQLIVELGRCALQSEDWREARRLFKEALVRGEEKWGEVHPLTLAAMSGLALTMKSEGAFGDARTLFERALELQRGSLGKGAFETLTSMGHLAALKRRFGALEEARKLWHALLAEAEISCPEEVLSIAEWRLEYGRFLSAVDSGAKAEALLRQSYDAFAETLGEPHEKTRMAAFSLSTFYRGVGEEAKARQWMDRSRDEVDDQ